MTLAGHMYDETPVVTLALPEIKKIVVNLDIYLTYSSLNMP